MRGLAVVVVVVVVVAVFAAIARATLATNDGRIALISSLFYLSTVDLLIEAVEYAKLRVSDLEWQS